MGSYTLCRGLDAVIHRIYGALHLSYGAITLSMLLHTVVTHQLLHDKSELFTVATGLWCLFTVVYRAYGGLCVLSTVVTPALTPKIWAI